MPTLPDKFRGAAAHMLHGLAQHWIRDWHPGVRRIVNDADVSATFPVNIRSVHPVEPWPTTTVTLLGDAIHTMSPGRAEGANTALRDAHLLRDTLVAVKHGTPLLDAVARYEAEMLRYGFDAAAPHLSPGRSASDASSSSPTRGSAGGCDCHRRRSRPARHRHVSTGER